MRDCSEAPPRNASALSAEMFLYRQKQDFDLKVSRCIAEWLQKLNEQHEEEDDNTDESCKNCIGWVQLHHELPNAVEKEAIKRLEQNGWSVTVARVFPKLEPRLVFRTLARRAS
jgi:hypothetical protein